MVGGYKMVSFGNVNIASEGGATIDGIYEAFENNYNKPLMIGDVTIDNVEKPNVYIDYTIADSNYTFSAYGKTFTVANDNKVTIA